MDDNLQKITNALNLRPPQAESLKLFAVDENFDAEKKSGFAGGIVEGAKIFHLQKTSAGFAG